VIGDRLVITDYHRSAAGRVVEHIDTLAHRGPLAVTVSGESGSGKSETAHCIAEILEKRGLVCTVLAQDDYFELPPRSNHERRLEDFEWIGPGEVRLELLDSHVAALKAGSAEGLRKPLVFFEENRIGEEVLPPGPFDVIVVEGTYTALLENVDVRVFIDRDYRQTKKARLARARDPDTEFLERVLEREHRIITTHRERADVIVDPPEEERDVQSS
jgi:uridine kinase